jgi:hypothetical protein
LLHHVRGKLCGGKWVGGCELSVCVCVYKHTCIHANMHTYIHIHIYVRIIQTYMHACEREREGKLLAKDPHACVYSSRPHTLVV